MCKSIIFYLNGSHYLLFDWISESHPPCLPRAACRKDASLLRVRGMETATWSGTIVHSQDHGCRELWPVLQQTWTVVGFVSGQIHYRTFIPSWVPFWEKSSSTSSNWAMAELCSWDWWREGSWNPCPRNSFVRIHRTFVWWTSRMFRVELGV